MTILSRLYANNQRKMSKTWYFDQLDMAQQAEVVAKTALRVAPGGRFFSKRFEDKKESLVKMMLEAASKSASLSHPCSVNVNHNEGSIAVNGNAIVQSSSNKCKVAPETNEDVAAVTPTKRVKPPLLKPVPSSL